MSRLTVISIALLLVLTLVSCGQNGTKKPSEPDFSAAESANPPAGVSTGSQAAETERLVEPEELISRQEAEELLGEPVKEGEKKEQHAVGQKICYYGGQDEDSGRFLQISVVQTAFIAETALTRTAEEIYFETKEALTETSEQRKIEGVGDEYFFGTPGLHILKDGYYLSIAVGNTGGGKDWETLGLAGARAVGNLENILSR